MANGTTTTINLEQHCLLYRFIIDLLVIGIVGYHGLSIRTIALRIILLSSCFYEAR